VFTYQVCQTPFVTRLVLASTSPARLKVLRDAGIEPLTIAPEVDEDAVEDRYRAMGLINSTSDVVHVLAQAKAEAVAAMAHSHGALVLGCDSQLDLAGESLGKPHDPDVAIARWKRLRGSTGVLYSGHWLIDNRNPEPGKLPPAIGKVSSTVVHFENISDAEIEAYVATGEPLKVAGAFTIDGLGGAFLRSIEGDAHTVIGISLSVLRQLTLSLGVEYTDLWNRK
jgi:septum formation protein